MRRLAGHLPGAWPRRRPVLRGPVTLPANAGGDLYVEAACAAGDPGGLCDANPTHEGWAVARVAGADLLLANNASPRAANFSGSALQHGARGTAHLVFTAEDPGGPGVYSVTVAIDGRTVFTGTPNANGGACVAAGRDPATGALMFDHQQPCLQTETVDVPVPTAGLPDGPHQLSVTVTDAASNAALVRDQTIHTSNPEVTPAARRGVRAQFVISWRLAAPPHHAALGDRPPAAAQRPHPPPLRRPRLSPSGRHQRVAPRTPGGCCAPCAAAGSPPGTGCSSPSAPRTAARSASSWSSATAAAPARGWSA